MPPSARRSSPGTSGPFLGPFLGTFPGELEPPIRRRAVEQQHQIPLGGRTDHPHRHPAAPPVFPVLGGHLPPVGPVPAQRLGIGKALAEDPQPLSQGEQPAGVVQELSLALPELPIHPGDLVVLAVGVVVAALGPAHLVAVGEQGDAPGQGDGGQQAASHPFAHPADLGIVGGAFHPPVAGQVVVGAVPVVLAVGLVVLLLVAHQIGQRETVVTGDEVDARPRAAGVEQVAAAGPAGRQLGDGARIPAPEGPGGVPEAVVPFRPARGEAAESMPLGGEVPGFGDELDPGQHRVRCELPEEGGVGIEAAFPITAQGRREVEAKPVHVQLLDPLAQTGEEHLAHRRGLDIERIATAGEVLVPSRLGGLLPVVGGVVEALEGEGGAGTPPLGGVVEHHVDQHLQARVVEGAHHVPEFGALRAETVGGVAGVGGEEGEGAVAPVVGQSPLTEMPFGGRLVDGHQLHRGDPEPPEMREHRLGGEAPVGAAQARRHLRMATGEALDVALVDDRLGPGRPGRGSGCLRAFRRRVVDHDAAGHVGRAVLPAAPFGVAALEAQQGGVPARAAGHRPRPGVHQQLRRIEHLAVARVPGPVGPVAVELTGTDLGQAGPPDAALVAVEGDAARLVVGVRVLEQAQLETRGVVGENREGSGAAVPDGAQTALGGGEVHEGALYGMDGLRCFQGPGR